MLLVSELVSECVVIRWKKRRTFLTDIEDRKLMEKRKEKKWKEREEGARESEKEKEKEGSDGILIIEIPFHYYYYRSSYAR